MGLFKRGQTDVRVLLTCERYDVTLLRSDLFILEKIRTHKLKELVLDKADLENLEHLAKTCQHIYDNCVRKPLIKPKQLKEYVERLELFVNEIYARGYNQEITKHWTIADFYKELMGAGPNNTYMWLRACFKQGVQPYLIKVDALRRLADNSPDDVANLLKEFDIHIQTQSLEKYPEEWIAQLLSQKKVVIGHDDTLDKINFSILPFLIREGTVLEQLLTRRSTKGIYYQTLLEFSKKHGQRLCEMIPDFVSFPVDAVLTMDVVGKFHAFFQNKTKKVIVKANYSAASGRGRLSYLILDVDDPNAATEWYMQITKYQEAFRDIAKRTKATKRSAIMIQCMLVEHDTLHPFKNEFTEHLHLAAHKHNVVGDAVWDFGIKYVLMSRKGHWENTLPKNMNIIEVSKTTTSDLSHKKDDLAIVGEFLNLISPMGCHALDVVFGRFKKDSGITLFLLEANPGAVRGDFLGTNYHTQNDVMQQYLQWALDHFHGEADTAGKYSRMIFSQLEPEARKEFVQSLHDLWAFVNEILDRYIFFCSNTEKLLCNKPKLVQEQKEPVNKNDPQQLQL